MSNAETVLTPLEETNAKRHRCLEGYVILDLTQYLAGPFCTFILGALGATVIKVEPPAGGDGNRHQPPFVTSEGLRSQKLSVDDVGLAFLKRNPCKQSVALDLKNEGDYETFLRLAKHADACVHNFRPGVAEKLRVDAAHLKAANERLVYCEISGFGPYGAAVGDRRGVVDIIAQAMSGAMAFTGLPDGPPTKFTSPLGDQVAGVFGAIAVLSGLLQRDGGRGTGVAPALEVSMLSALSLMVWDEHHDVYHRAGEPERSGNGTGRIVPFNTYKTRDDKHVAIAAVSPLEWKRLTEATGIADFETRSDWAVLSNRVVDRLAIDALISAWTESLSREEVMERLLAAGVTAAPVYGIADILEDELFRKKLLYRVQHPAYGEVDALNAKFPIVVDSVQIGPYARPAPILDGDGAELLARYSR